MTRSSTSAPTYNSAMEKQVRHGLGCRHGADQVNTLSSNVDPDVAVQDDLPGATTQHQMKTPEQRPADSAPTRDTPSDEDSTLPSLKIQTCSHADLTTPAGNTSQDVSRRSSDLHHHGNFDMEPDILGCADVPDAKRQHQTSSDPQQDHPSTSPPGTPITKGSEQPISSSEAETVSQKDLTPSTETTPQDTPIMPESPHETFGLPRTPRCQPRRFKGACDCEVRNPTIMTPARIYRVSTSPGMCTQNAPIDQSGPETRILPIGELITSKGTRTYTIWANEQQPAQQTAVQVTITNTDPASTFTSYRGISRRPAPEVLDDFSSLLRTQGLALISLNVAKDSFVAVVSTEKGWDQLREGIMHVTR